MTIIKQLKASYTTKAFFEKRDSFITHSIYRPLSFYLTVPFIWMGISANTVTALSFMLALSASAAMAFGDYALSVIGSFIFFFALLLDYVDGNIARLKRETNYFGKFIDGLNDVVQSIFKPIAVAVGLVRIPDLVLANIHIEAGSALILFMGAMAALISCLHSNVIFRMKAVELEAKTSRNSDLVPAKQLSGVSAKQRSQNIKGRILDMANSLLKTVNYFLGVGIILFAVFKILSLFLLISLCVNSLLFLLDAARILAGGRRQLNIFRPF